MLTQLIMECLGASEQVSWGLDYRKAAGIRLVIFSITGNLKFSHRLLKIIFTDYCLFVSIIVLIKANTNIVVLRHKHLGMFRPAS